MTTVGKPRSNHPLGHLPAMNGFAPYGVFNVRPALSQPEFIAKYLARLDKNRDALIAELQYEFDTHGQRVVLLCWCKVTSTNFEVKSGFCHRLIAAHWVHRELGIEVPELSLRDRPGHQRLFDV